MATTEQRPELLTLAEAAAYLRVSERTTHRLIRNGGIPAVKVGHSWRFVRADLERRLMQTEEPAP